MSEPGVSRRGTAIVLTHSGVNAGAIVVDDLRVTSDSGTLIAAENAAIGIASTVNGSFTLRKADTIATVQAAETERGNDMLTAMAQRHGRQAIDLDALALLERGDRPPAERAAVGRHGVVSCSTEGEGEKRI